MKCPKCSAELPSNSSQCPSCGVFIVQSPAAVPPPAPKSRKMVIIASSLMVVIIAALVFSAAFKGKSVTQGNSPTPPPNKSLTNAAPPGVAGGPSITNAPLPTPPSGQPGLADPEKPGVPADVLAYLKFVGEVEKYRHKLLGDTGRLASMMTNQQAKSLIAMIDMASDPDSKDSDMPKQASEFNDEMNRQVSNWTALLQQFDKARAPQACAEFSGKYRAVLATELASMVKVGSIMTSMNWSDVDSLTKASSDLQAMKSDPNLQGNIDDASDEADKNLGDLSSRLGIDKPFDVKKESGGGGSIVGGGF